MRLPRRSAALALAVALACAAPAGAQAPQLVEIGRFGAPVHVAAPPGDRERVFVVEQGGMIWIVEGGARRQDPFLDVRQLVSVAYERGLLSVAFAPDFAASGRFYVYFTARDGDITIDEYRVSAADRNRADQATRRTVLTIEHSRYPNHNGGQLAFGPDGALYAGTGDGGGAGDPMRSGQNPSSLLGKLLRIDPASGTTEVFAMGLRNPFRFSFDRATGDLTIGDVGQSYAEEIDFVPRAAGFGRGANFGWNRLEGNCAYSDATATTCPTPTSFPAGYVAPVLVHTHGEGWCSVTGGVVVRDPELPALAGRYVYGDHCVGRVRAATLAAGGATGDTDLGLPVPRLSSFGEDGCGRVYAASLNGPVYRLAQSGACAAAPAPSLRLSLRFARRQRVLRRGLVALAASCSVRCTLEARGFGLRRVRRTGVPDARVVLRPRLTRAGRARARRARTLRVRVTARDGSGRSRTRVVRVAVVR